MALVKLSPAVRAEKLNDEKSNNYKGLTLMRESIIAFSSLEYSKNKSFVYIL